MCECVCVFVCALSVQVCVCMCACSVRQNRSVQSASEISGWMGYTWYIVCFVVIYM